MINPSEKHANNSTGKWKFNVDLHNPGAPAIGNSAQR